MAARAALRDALRVKPGHARPLSNGSIPARRYGRDKATAAEATLAASWSA